MTEPCVEVQTHAGRIYRVLGPLGQGSFGRVVRAHLVGSHGFTRDVAIKVGISGSGHHVSSRLSEEARVLSLVRHRAIVHIDDLIELDDGLGLVMEYIDGLDLARVLSMGSLPLGAALEIVSEVAGALDCAQRVRGPGGRPLLLQHRDVKPANIMITGNGETRLLDFGVAHANLAGEAWSRAPSCGSVGYVAPERLCDTDHVNSDIYSLGVVLYEAISGRRFGSPPFDRTNHRVWRERALRALPAGMAPAALRLLSEMLAWAPDERPNAREVERRAGAIARAQRVTLRDWAEAAMPDLRIRIGAVHDERASLEPSGPPSSGSPPRTRGREDLPSAVVPATAATESRGPSTSSPLLSPGRLGVILALWAALALVAVYWTG